MVELETERGDIATSIYSNGRGATDVVNRWADVQMNGALDAVDQGVTHMVLLAEVITRTRDASEADSLLDDLEAAAYSTALTMRYVLALDPRQLPVLPFDAGYMLSAAVEQFLPRVILVVLQTIEAGATLAVADETFSIAHDVLSALETEYLDWAMPNLIVHLLPEAEDYDV